MRYLQRSMHSISGPKQLLRVQAATVGPCVLFTRQTPHSLGLDLLFPVGSLGDLGELLDLGGSEALGLVRSVRSC